MKPILRPVLIEIEKKCKVDFFFIVNDVECTRH
jgi:hypothetical protein